MIGLLLDAVRARPAYDDEDWLILLSSDHGGAARRASKRPGFTDHCGGELPIPTLAAVWPLRSLKMALRLHHEVPGILVPDDLLAALEAAGGDAAEVGYERAVEVLRQAPDHAAGVYLIAPFKQPQAILPVIDDAAND